MIGALLPALVGNLLFAMCLASIAYAIHRSGRDPRLAHLLWVVVLLKLITPPLLPIPGGLPGSLLTPRGSPSVDGAAGAGGDGVLGELLGRPVAETIHRLGEPAALTFLVVWAIGSLAVLGVSLVHVRRFERLLAQAARPAPGEVREAGRHAARRLGLRSLPAIEVVHARLTPMTWWTGGHVRILLPSDLCDELGQGELRWILAHELAHVKRRDHLVRWLEWLVGTIFWWNPLVWWARRCLRADEEAACDALVLRRVAAEPRPYAEALLGVAVFLSGTPQPSLVLATGVGAHGPLEQRFRAILARRHERAGSRRLVVAATSLSLLLASLGFHGSVRPADAIVAQGDSSAGAPLTAARDAAVSTPIGGVREATPGADVTPGADAARPDDAALAEEANDATATETYMMLSAAITTASPQSLTPPSRPAGAGHAATARQLQRALVRVERALADARHSVRAALQRGDQDAVASERAQVRALKARVARLEARLERETGLEPATSSLEG